MSSTRTSVVIRNDTQDLLGIYVEPYPSDYWLQPGEQIKVTGAAGTGEWK